MNKLFRWFEEVVAPNTAAARKKAEDAFNKAEEATATGGSVLRPVLLAKPVYESALERWTVESTQELAVGDEVTLLRGDDKIAIANLMVKARITGIASTLNDQGKFTYIIDIFFKEPTNDRDTNTESPSVS
jgi:hypothetical protein